MTTETLVGLAKHAMHATLLVSAPMLLAGLIIGLIVSIFQAVTQIQEMTLTFIPKIVAVFLALLVAFPWMLDIMMSFTINIFELIPTIVR